MNAIIITIGDELLIGQIINTNQAAIARKLNAAGVAATRMLTVGDEMGAITQNPVGIGTQCVIAAVKAIQGISQPTNVDTGFYWYDKTNITDPNIVADLYQ